MPISTLKKIYLENLCKQNIIPTRYHEEYFSHQCKSSVRDELSETDEEDAFDTK